MTKLWILSGLSLVLAFLAQRHDETLSSRGNNRRDRIFTLMLILMLGTYCGLRTWFNDTVTYLQIYAQTPLLPDFYKTDNLTFAVGWGFALMNSIIKTIGFSAQDYLMFYAFLTVTPYVLFVRKYCPHFAFGVFLMFTTGFYSFTFAAIKQCMATGLCLMAVMAALDRKWIRYLICLFVSVLFHPYSIVYLIVPLMVFRPFTKWTYVCIMAAFSVGFSLEAMLGTILDITDMMGAVYDINTFLGEGINLFRVLVAFVPIVLGFFYQRILFDHSTKSENLMFNLCMLNALIMFIGLFGTANYFARLANYFLPAQVVILPWMLNKIPEKDAALLKIGCILGYTGYFYYDNAIIRPFDANFSQISLWAYLKSHF